MTQQLRVLAGHCDGVRTDMAMLVLADVFRSTWNERSLPPTGDGAIGEFWATAIDAVHRDRPDFLLIAETYWGLEWRLQQLGFDYTFDKTFYDRLVTGDGPGLAAHLRAGEDFQRRSVRFLENHDEARAAASLSPSHERLGAVLAATSPGMLLVHDGQLGGVRVRSPVQFARRPDEPAEAELRRFYDRLLDVLRESGLRQATSVRIDPAQAWEGNTTHEGFVARLWRGPGNHRYLSVINLASSAAQCYVPIPEPGLAGRSIVLEDLLGHASYERAGDELLAPGLFLDIASEAYHLFRIHPEASAPIKPGVRL